MQIEKAIANFGLVRNLLFILVLALAVGQAELSAAPVNASMRASVVQGVEAIAAACRKRDSAAMSKLMLDKINFSVTTPRGRQEAAVPRAKILKGILLTRDKTMLMQHPFIGQAPVSGRVSSISHLGQGRFLVRLIVLQPIMKDGGMGLVASKEKVPMLQDLTVRDVHGDFVLTGLDLMPKDWWAQVGKPHTTQSVSQQLDTTKSIALYNKLWGKFIGSQPKDKPVPDNRTKPTMTLLPTIPVLKELPNPPVKRMPPARVTRRVRRVRREIDALLAKRYVAFVNKLIAEYFTRSNGRRCFYSVHQRRWSAQFGPRQFRIVTQLVFVSSPNRPLQEYSYSTVEPTTPPKFTAIPTTPIKLAPPKVKPAAGCMVLTDLTRLRKKHGARFDSIRAYLQAWGPIIDLAGRSDVDAVIEKEFNRAGRDCLFIFGNHDIVPYVQLPNPTQGRDKETYVFSDDPYGDFDHDKMHSPEIMVVRMPDDPGILADTNSVLYRDLPSDDSLRLSGFAVYGNLNRCMPEVAAKLANGSPSKHILRSSPHTQDTFPRDFFAGKNVWINMHGGDGDATFYNGEKADGSQFASMNLTHANAPDALVFSVACFGGSTVYDARNGTFIPKTSDNHIGLRFLRNGARGLVGFTKVTWQSVRHHDPTLSAEGIPFTRMLHHMKQGRSPQKAFMLTKRELAAQVPNYSAEHQKMYHQMVYLGLPPAGGRDIVPPASPERPSTLKQQVIRTLSDFRRQADRKDVDKMLTHMTPSIRESIKDGPEVDSRQKAEQLLRVFSNPKAPNPLNTDLDLDKRCFLIERSDKDKEFVASFRMPLTRPDKISEDRPETQRQYVQRMTFKIENDEIKLRSWEHENPEFVEKVVKPHGKWLASNRDSSPDEALDNYESMLESFIDDSVTNARKSNKIATSLANPLFSPDGIGGENMRYLLYGGAIIGVPLLIILVVVSSKKRKA